MSRSVSLCGDLGTAGAGAGLGELQPIAQKSKAETAVDFSLPQGWAMMRAAALAGDKLLEFRVTADGELAFALDIHRPLFGNFGLARNRRCALKVHRLNPTGCHIDFSGTF